MKKGKEYEMLIEQLYRRLEPNAKIIQDDHIFGIDTNTYRQIDVSIRYSFAGIKNLIIIQAKDYKNPADINKVGEFLSVIRDVNANKGILICANGFTKKAIEYAKNKGIELLTLHSAQNKKWEKLLKVNIQRNVHHFQMDEQLSISVGDKAGKRTTITFDTYSYDKYNIIGLVDIIYDNIILKNSWKEIIKGKAMTFSTKDRELFHLLDYDMMPVSGHVTIKYVRSITTNFQIDPVDYSYMVDHINKTEKLHDLTISIDDMDKIALEEFKNDPDVKDDFHIKAHVFEFNNLQFIMIKEFLTKGFISGDGFYKGPALMKRDERGELLVKLETILKEGDQNKSAN
ncbi:restriction endonuclease [Sphingobacterium sp.]|uniref:restriction endonuclease n=1 Tax=Sphingobacterium sp. TaxID=341027 RepID=UPI00289C5144|nr:restriction endonuclease [Sphingobacterium sp.]